MLAIWPVSTTSSASPVPGSSLYSRRSPVTAQTAPPTATGVGITSPGVSWRHRISPVSGSSPRTPLSPVPRYPSEPSWKKRFPNPTNTRPSAWIISECTQFGACACQSS